MTGTFMPTSAPNPLRISSYSKTSIFLEAYPLTSSQNKIHLCRFLLDVKWVVYGSESLDSMRRLYKYEIHVCGISIWNRNLPLCALDTYGSWFWNINLPIWASDTYDSWFSDKKNRPIWAVDYGILQNLRFSSEYALILQIKVPFLNFSYHARFSFLQTSQPFGSMSVPYPVRHGTTACYQYQDS